MPRPSDGRLLQKDSSVTWPLNKHHQVLWTRASGGLGAGSNSSRVARESSKHVPIRSSVYTSTGTGSSTTLSSSRRTTRMSLSFRPRGLRTHEGGQGELPPGGKPGDEPPTSSLVVTELAWKEAIGVWLPGVFLWSSLSLCPFSRLRTLRFPFPPPPAVAPVFQASRDHSGKHPQDHDDQGVPVQLGDQAPHLPGQEGRPLDPKEATKGGSARRSAARKAPESLTGRAPGCAPRAQRGQRGGPGTRSGQRKEPPAPGIQVRADPKPRPQ